MVDYALSELFEASREICRKAEYGLELACGAADRRTAESRRIIERARELLEPQSEIINPQHASPPAEEEAKLQPDGRLPATRM